MKQDILKQLKDLRDELHRDGWGPQVPPDIAHVRNVVDNLIEIVIKLAAREEVKR